MPQPYAVKTRKEIRQAIGYNLGAIIVGTTSSTAFDKTRLLDTFGLAVGGTRDYIGRQVLLVSGTNDGEKSFVAAFDNATSDATLAPAVANNIASGDKYEMWEDFRVEQIHDLITQAIVAASDDIFKDKVGTSLVKKANFYAYDIPSGFVALDALEFEKSIKIDLLIPDGAKEWDELVDPDVAVEIDTTLFDTNSLKLVVAAGAGAGDILATEDITSLDITDCDEIVAEVYSSVALDAGDLQILLDDTAQCASPTESLDIPAITANTKTDIVISLADIPSDSAIISVGIKMIVDKGAFTFYIRNIRAQNSQSRVYHRLSPEAWDIVQGSTSELKLSTTGYAAIGNNRRLRLSGYQKPSELTSDSSNADIDPEYIVAYVVGRLYAVKGDAEGLRQATFWLGEAARLKRQGRTSMRENTRWIGR